MCQHQLPRMSDRLPLLQNNWSLDHKVFHRVAWNLLFFHECLFQSNTQLYCCRSCMSSIDTRMHSVISSGFNQLKQCCKTRKLIGMGYRKQRQDYRCLSELSKPSSISTESRLSAVKTQPESLKSKTDGMKSLCVRERRVAARTELVTVVEPLLPLQRGNITRSVHRVVLGPRIDFPP